MHGKEEVWWDSWQRMGGTGMELETEMKPHVTGIGRV